MRYLKFFLLFFIMFIKDGISSTQLPSFINNSSFFVGNDISGISIMPDSNGLIITNNGKLLFQHEYFNLLNTILNVNPGGSVSISNNGEVYVYSSPDGRAFFNMNGNSLSSRNIGQIVVGYDSSFIVGEKNFGRGIGYLNLYDSYLYSYSLLQNNKAGVINIVSSLRNTDQAIFPSSIVNVENSQFQNYGIVNIIGANNDVYDRSSLLFENDASYSSLNNGKIFLSKYADIVNLSNSNNADLLSNIFVVNDGSLNQRARMLFFNNSNLSLLGNNDFQIGNMNSFNNYTINSIYGSLLLDFRNQNIDIASGALWKVLSSSNNVNLSLYDSNLNILDGGWVYIDSVLSNAGNIYLNEGGRLSFGKNAVYNIGTNIGDGEYFYNYVVNNINGVNSNNGNFYLGDKNTIIDIASSDDSMWKNFLSQNFLNNGTIFIRANMTPLQNMNILGDGDFSIVDNAILNLSYDFNIDGTLNVGNNVKTDFDKSLIGEVEINNATLSANEINIYADSSLGLYDGAIVDVKNDFNVNGLLFGDGSINLNNSPLMVSNGGWITSNVNSILKVNGDLFLQNNGGYLAIIEPKTSVNPNAIESKLIVNGEVGFENDSSILVVSNGRIIDGKENVFPVLIADYESTTNPLNIAQHLEFRESLFTNYTAKWVIETSGEYAGKNVLYIVTNPSNLNIKQVPGLSFNEYQIADVVNDLYDVLNLETELNDVVNFIYTDIGSVSFLKKVLNDLSVEKYADFLAFMPQINDVIKQPIIDRLNPFIKNDYLESELWIYPLHSSISQKNVNEYIGFDNDFYGVSFGFDKVLKGENSLLGIAFVLGDSSFSSKDKVIDIDSALFGVDVYALSELKNFFIDYGVGFSSFVNDSYFNFVNLEESLNTDASFDTYIVDTFLDFGYKWKFDDFYFYPKIGLNISYIDQEGFCENGDGGVNRCIEQKDFTLTQIPLYFYFAFNKKLEDFVFNPSFFIGYSRFMVDDVYLTAMFENTDLEFNSVALPFAKDKFSFGLDLNLDFYNQFDISLQFISDFKNDYKNNQIVFGLDYKF